MDFGDDLDSLCDRAVMDADAGGGHWNVAFGSDAVVKVPTSQDVSEEVVEENMEIADEIGIEHVETEIRYDLGDLGTEFAQVQPCGLTSAEYCGGREEDFLRGVTDILDEVADTEYIIDAKMSNFVVLDGEVLYCDLGDGASFSQRRNDHMFQKFITTYRDIIDESLPTVDKEVQKHSDYYESNIAVLAPQQI